MKSAGKLNLREVHAPGCHIGRHQDFVVFSHDAGWFIKTEEISEVEEKEGAGRRILV